MKPEPVRGEVWWADLGLTAKVRPCLVLSTRLEESDRALITLVVHTTSLRGSRHEISVRTRFLKKSGAFDVQNLITIPTAKLTRKMGVLTSAQMKLIEDAVRLRLGL